ncbi:cation transporter [Mycobacterium intracellulare]|uniref:cation transporter n=1 Tax=Mycobacterium intracellulare TaxID=1767 RepID=UPI001E14FE93|nr:cation transporter [Mycobacterium intracellulare]
MTSSDSAVSQAAGGDVCCTATTSAFAVVVQRDSRWHAAARWARRLAWVSLVFVVSEGAVGLWQGVATGSVALTAWALGSAPEAIASLIVIWRFSGARILSEKAELRARRGVAVSFWLSAPYIAAESMHHLLNQHASHTTLIGVVLTAAALVQMPILGRAQHKLGARLGSGATVGKGIQNYLCAAQAAAVLLGLAVTLRWSGGWWLDPAIGLGIAIVAVWQGWRSWRGEDCGC